MPCAIFTLREGLTLVLASASPRRRQFLEEWGLPFRVCQAQGPEPQPTRGERPAAYAQRAATAKAQAVARDLDAAAATVLLAADTVVSLDGTILGKPENADHALAMLQRLNGRCHEVISAVCLLLPATLWPVPYTPKAGPALPKLQIRDYGHWRQLVFSDTSQVCFSHWPLSALQAYVGSGEAQDKAGAYAIQGQGAFLAERVDGSWSTVVGLPLSPLASLLLHCRILASG